MQCEEIYVMRVLVREFAVTNLLFFKAVRNFEMVRQSVAEARAM